MICDGLQSCQNTRIQCPLAEGTECNIECLSRGSCHGAIIDGKFTTLAINCISKAACSRLTVNGDFNSSIASTNTFTIFCIGDSSCKSLIIDDPPLTSATIYCSGSSACKDSIFNLSTTTQLVDVHCTPGSTGFIDWNDTLSCYGSVIWANAANSIHIDCDNSSCHQMGFRINNAVSANFSFYGISAAQNSTIYGNVRDRLIINCDAASSCSDSTIWADQMDQIGTGVSLKCNDPTIPCSGIQIYCPQGDAYCDIDCASTFDPCPNMTVAIENENYDLDLDCADTGCYFHFGIKCMDTMLITKLQRVDNVLECKNQDCCPPALRPTIAPTTEPSIAPSTAPTTAPAKSPTTAQIDSSPSETSDMNMVTVIIIVIPAVVLIVVGTLLWMCYRKKKDNLTKTVQEMVVIGEDEQPGESPDDTNTSTIVTEQRKDEFKMAIENIDTADDDNAVAYDMAHERIETMGTLDDMYAESEHHETIGATDQGINDDNQMYAINWSTERLIEWIVTIENGRYQKYKDKLNEKMEQEEVSGNNLIKVSEQDLRYYGIVNIDDRHDLFVAIQHLIESQQYKPQSEGQGETQTAGDVQQGNV